MKDVLISRMHSLNDEPDGQESPNKRGKLSSKDVSPYSSLREQMEAVEQNDENESETHPMEVREELIDDQTSKQGFNCFNWMIALLAILAVIASYFIFDGQRFLGDTQFNDSVIGINEWQTFESEFSSFERNYSEVIPIKGFKILNSSVKKVMNRNKRSQRMHNSSPAILLLIATEENQNVLKCVVKGLVDSINKAYNENNPIVINGKRTDATDIVDKFDLNFRDNKKHTIIIENIESIEAKDVMSLHQFTDHENAKYKDVIIVMTAINYQKLNVTKSANPREMDAIASQLFQIKWKNFLPEEQSFALISRLTPSVVTLIGRTENKFMC